MVLWEPSQSPSFQSHPCSVDKGRVILPSVTHGMLVWGSTSLKPGIYTCKGGKNYIELRLVYVRKGGSCNSKI